MIFDPSSVEVTCMTLSKDHFIHVPWNMLKYVDTVTLFFQKHSWTKDHWLLDDPWPQVCWVHTQGSLCPHENTSKYVDTVTFFSKTWTKGHWPIDDLWPHICWSHMCNSTQGSLCPSPMGIHQCMWIQWSIFQNTTYYIHTTYYGQNEWSHL